jgi:hypothetical protein
MPDFDVTIKLSQLQNYEKELAQLKARNRFLEISYHAEQQAKAGSNLLEAKQDIIDALKDAKTKVQNELIDANDTIEHLRYGTQQLQKKVDKLQEFIGSRGLKTGCNYNIYKLVDDNEKLNQELDKKQTAINALICDRQMNYDEYQKVAKEQKEYLTACHASSSESYRNVIDGLKSALAIEVANVCDLDQEIQDLIKILSLRNDSINQLEAINIQLKNQLAATAALNTSFTLSGDYQVTKISRGEAIFNQVVTESTQQKSLSTWIKDNQEQESNPEDFDTWQGQETPTWDDDIDDEPDPSIGW